MTCRKCKAEIPNESAYCLKCGTSQETKKRKTRTHGNGLGTVFWDKTSWCAERTNGWEAKSEDGKLTVSRKYKKKRGFKTKREALQYLGKLIDIDTQRPISTIAQLYEAYSESAMLKLSKDKIGAYKNAYKRISPLHNKLITSIRISELNNAIVGLSHYPAKDIRDLVSNLYKIAIVEEQVQTNRALSMVLPELTDEKETTPWETEEVKTLWLDWKSGGRIAGACLVMIYSGMMPGELFKLEEQMINWSSNTILGCGMKTKKRKEKPIVFPDFIAPVLRDLYTTTPSKINRVLGMNRDRFYDEFKLMKQRLGIREEVRPYSSRHSTSTALSLAKVPVALIVEIMRHKNYTTTLKYYNEQQTKELVDAVNQLRIDP